LGATIGVLMEAGEGEFGDHEFMAGILEDIRDGNEKGKLYAQGTTRVGEHYNVARIPAIKKQAISAYDPREIEVTGISMMVTAQGADHTAGNIPTFQCKDKTTEELVAASLDIQEDCAAADSLGLCLFGRSVTNINQEFIADALNSAHGTDLVAGFMKELGREALALEWQFNKDAGLTDEDDELPQFFYDEILAGKEVAARHHTAEVNAAFRELIEKS
jgi:aldehyde:ferredoxin oxidoreductase